LYRSLDYRTSRNPLPDQDQRNGCPTGNINPTTPGIIKTPVYKKTPAAKSAPKLANTNLKTAKLPPAGRGRGFFQNVQSIQVKYLY